MIEQIQAEVFLKCGYIVLNNFLPDMPAMGIAGDNIDRDRERTPHRWDIRMIRNYMITFGLVSTVFDLLTFGVLLYLAGEMAEIFRTGWFVESLLNGLLILFVIRTYKPFYREPTRPVSGLEYIRRCGACAPPALSAHCCRVRFRSPASHVTGFHAGRHGAVRGDDRTG